ncbi:MAG: EF-P lysine aminoacylase EpmA [Woeseia sp.]
MKAAPPESRWHPTATLATARVRAGMLAQARRFFAIHDVLEVETPALSQAAVSDPNIESIAVTLSAATGHRYYLHTSPEFAMKRLLCAGWPDIYQLCKVFRDGEAGKRHQPEFTMVEWYRRNFELHAMMRHTVDFICTLLDRQVDAAAAEYISYRDVFLRHVRLDPLAASVTELQKASDADDALIRTLGDARDAWLDLLLSTQIAPNFKTDRLTVVHHYPASQAALARRCPDRPDCADRFEVFCGELELANGYFELTDAEEQQQRCERDQQHRAQNGATVRPLDQDFLAALRAGLPSCCGVAVGFDRLVMLKVQTEKLSDVQTFSAINFAND